MSERLLIAAILVCAGPGLIAAAPSERRSDEHAQYTNVLAPNPSGYRYAHVWGLNEHGEVLIESPADPYPLFSTCENYETYTCAPAIWSEKDGYRPIPGNRSGNLRLNDRG